VHGVADVSEETPKVINEWRAQLLHHKLDLLHHKLDKHKHKHKETTAAYEEAFQQNTNCLSHHLSHPAIISAIRQATFQQ
jgi:hypothetical protein